MPLDSPAGVGLLVDRHEARQPHEPTYAFLIHQMAFVAQMPGHLPDPEEWRFQELLIDLAHEDQVQRRLALGLVVE